MSWFADFFWSDPYKVVGGIILFISIILFIASLCTSVFTENKKDRVDFGRFAFAVLIFGPLLALIWHLIIPLTGAVVILVMLVVAFRNAKFGDMFKKDLSTEEVDA